MVPVIIESPYAETPHTTVQENLRYGRACLRYALEHGYAPFASHLLYTQDGVLGDKDLQERSLGIQAGFVIGGSLNAAVLVFADYGISPGMTMGIEYAEKEGREVIYIYLGTSHLEALGLPVPCVAEKEDVT